MIIVYNSQIIRYNFMTARMRGKRFVKKARFYVTPHIPKLCNPGNFELETLRI